MDINERLNEAIEKQDWDAVKQIQAEILKPKNPKTGRPKKVKTVVETVDKPTATKKRGRPKGSKNTTKKSKTVEPEDKAMVKPYEWSPPPGANPGYTRPNLFEDDLEFENQDLDVPPLSRDISKRKGKLREEAKDVKVNCDRCGKTYTVHPNLIGVSIGTGGASGYRCDRCIGK